MSKISVTSFSCLLLVGTLFAQENGTLQFSISDAERKPVPCRIHLKNAEGQPIKPPSLPFWRDHFVCDGTADLDVPAGSYSYTIERGPEFRRVRGEVDVTMGETSVIAATLKRLAHLRELGWYSGDLHIHRPVEQVEQLMNAEDLDYGPVITWWNQRNLWERSEIPSTLTRRFSKARYLSIMAGEDEREGGALLFFGLKTPLGITDAEREYPSPMEYVNRSKEINANVWIDIEKPFWWDVPVWIASGQMKSIGIANNHMCHSTMLANEAWGRPRDTERLPSPNGNGYWTQEIFYHILNTGIRITPSAGSASGVLPNPVGYNRVYVKLDQPFTPEAWWSKLADSNCFVTNGPILLVSANGQLPGSVLNSSKVELEMQAISQDSLASIQIIQNGKIVHSISPSKEESQTHYASFEIDSSSWFLVRAITDRQETFRFASTAPFYLELENKPTRVSRSSCQFFEDWVSERIERVKRNVRDPDKRNSVLAFQNEALEFWRQKKSTANAP